MQYEEQSRVKTEIEEAKLKEVQYGKEAKFKGVQGENEIEYGLGNDPRYEACTTWYNWLEPHTHHGKATAFSQPIEEYKRALESVIREYPMGRQIDNKGKVDDLRTIRKDEKETNWQAFNV